MIAVDDVARELIPLNIPLAISNSPSFTASSLLSHPRTLSITQSTNALPGYIETS